MPDNSLSRSVTVSFRVNGVEQKLTVDPRYALADVLRDELSLTGLHLGCEQGACGACMVLIDGEPALSCLTLAVEVEGRDIQTVENLTPPGPELGALGKSFIENCAFQCGYCTPGVLVMAHHLLNKGIAHDREKVRAHLSGNICRCTGYEPIVDAIVAAGKDWKAR